MVTPNVRTLAFAMVKNELDIIEPFVRHNLQYVDALIVFDHYSTDGTRDVLIRLSQEYDNLAVGTYDGDAQDQGTLLSKQLAKFQQKFRADFVVFLDADEFIDFETGMDLASCTRDLSSGDVGLIPWRTYIPDPDAPKAVAEPLDRFTLRRRLENPSWYKVILRLDGAIQEQFRIAQGSHSVQTKAGKKIPAKILSGVHLMHFPVRSMEQLVAKSKIGSLTNSLRSVRHAKAHATQWQRVASMERSGEIRDGGAFLFEEAMIYAQSPYDGDLHANVETSAHGITAVRRYSDGQRQSADKLFEAEIARIRSQLSYRQHWLHTRLPWLETNEQIDDLQAVQYLVRKYGQSGVFFDLDFAGLSGFSTASQTECAVQVRLLDVPLGNDFLKAPFDTLVAQALSGSNTLRNRLCVFLRSGQAAKIVP